MEKKYEKVSHTADVRLRVWGKDYKELFENAALGLSSVIYENAERLLDTKHFDRDELMEIRSANMNMLIVDFLNDILGKIHIYKMVYKARIENISENTVKAKILGKRVDRFDEDVKAVTYHSVAIRKDERGAYETLVVLDI